MSVMCVRSEYLLYNRGAVLLWVSHDLLANVLYLYCRSMLEAVSCCLELV